MWAPTLSSSSCSSEEREESSGEATLTPVYLNVYDLTPVNNYLYWFGIGIFHSGIEAHGLEYCYGAHEYPSSGVYEVEPRNCPGFIFRRSVLLGTTTMSRSDFRTYMEKLSRKYHGDTYHLIAKNCNHFTEEVCSQLTGKPIPGWINRLARVRSVIVFCQKAFSLQLLVLFQNALNSLMRRNQTQRHLLCQMKKDQSSIS
ncbi:deSI-like protein At4g17486 isoform X2 [Capsella rubella]|uniref:deSI-like protein At4g17486 isoform X2 n=1 Tax=Capsella rubella TaxID=81985 RepID=UPI000CD4FD43|nr:deSI-like protein At4g17486 isoform X2 [Capsella rubella]